MFNIMYWHLSQAGLTLTLMQVKSGTIDSDYQGEVKVCLIYLSNQLSNHFWI